MGSFLKYKDLNKFAMKGERVSTGIKGLDAVLEGGFPKGKMIVVSGGVGKGKTTFGLQYIGEGLKKGEPSLIISTKETPSGTRETAKSFGINLEKWEREEMLKIIFYTPNEFRSIIGGGGATILDLIDDISASRLFVDSLGFVSSSFDNFSDLLSFSYNFLNTFRRANVTTLSTVEHAHRIEKMEIWQHLADGAINLYEKEEKMKRKKIMEITKMKFTKVKKNVLEYTITEKGLEVKK